MKVLFVSHRLPFPPTHGGRIRSFNMIRHLAQRHDVTVASLAHSTEEVQSGTELAKYCSCVIVERVSAPIAIARMISRLPTPTPSSMAYFHSPALKKRIRREIAKTKFDLIVVHCAFVAPYVADFVHAPKVLDFCDMDSQKWLSYAKARLFPLSVGYWIDGVKLQRAEARLAAKFELCTCTTPSELEVLRGYGVTARLGCFPNGVDSEYFKPADVQYEPDALCFVGRMDYYPNEECMIAFCREVLPLIRARRPAARLTIVGASPSRRIRDLSQTPGVSVTGWVPDVRPYLHASAVSLAPLRIARGIQNKILEAMSMGIPTVASVTAAKGVDAEPGRHLLTASSPREYADAILRLLEDSGERTRLSLAARAHVLSHHTWEQSMRTLDGLIEECVVDRAVPR